MAQLQDLLKYQQEIYETTVSKGFWEEGDKRNRGEMVMLIITELSEAVEAHRKGKRYKATHNWLNNVLPALDEDMSPGQIQYFIQEFQIVVKDTVEDEMADAVIRILDYCAGWRIELQECTRLPTTSNNFAEDVLSIVNALTEAYAITEIRGTSGSTHLWGSVLDKIIKFCEWWGINLEQHVAWKLCYNKTRAYKHGKSY